MPADGNAAPVWTGMIEPDALPRAFNPPLGAHLLGEQRNRSRVQGPRSPATGRRAFRASRLRDQLSNAQGVDLDAMAALQNDRHSVAADVVLAGARRRDQDRRDRARAMNAEALLLEQLVEVGSRGRRAAGGVAL